MSDIIQANDPFTQPCFSLGNRAKRAAWGLVWSLLFRPSPALCYGWRNMLLRLFGARIGKGVHVKPSVQIWAPWNLAIEDLASMGNRVICYTMGPITLRRKCVVSQGAHLCAGTHDHESPNFQLLAKPIVIGAESWICTEAFVGPGVTIGDGAVVGARAVAVKDMPAWTVCAGNPCKPIRPRVVRPQ